jgi:dTDP-4-amino-4,6-dideoxygalactose transaminase
MNPAFSPFSVPREQWLTWKHLSMLPLRNAGNTSHSETGRHSFFWARNALHHALCVLNVPRTGRALLPAYLCRAAAEPFAAYGLECDFYDVGRDCALDLGEVEAKLRPETRVLLAVHYFGFPQQIEALSRLCLTRNLFLFEDCAHVLPMIENSKMFGMIGDASVFSFRKFLPIFDGAQLWLSKTKEFGWKADHSRFNIQAARFVASQTINSSSSVVARFAKKLIESVRSPRGTKSETSAENSPTPESVDNNSPSFDPTLLTQPMTSPSRWILRHSTLASIAACRRSNFTFLQNNLCDFPGVIPLFRELPQGVCPWVYPLFLDGIANAHLLLRSAGIPAVTWGGVRVGSVSGAQYPRANFLYENLVFLPVHQNLSNEHLQTIVDVVRKVGSESRKLLARGTRAIG